MGFNFIVDDRDLAFLLPQDVRDWLPPGHLCWQVIKAVDDFDLSVFLGSYRTDGQGHPAYHPVMMVGLVLYCYCKGVRSSRAIEAACFDDVGCRVITANRRVDHATVARFVRRHQAALRELFVQVLTLCVDDGLVEVDLVAGDGTKVKANASKSASGTLEQLNDKITELEAAVQAEVDSFLAQVAANGDEAGAGLAVPDGQGRPPAAAPRRTAGKLERAQVAKAALVRRHGDTVAAVSALDKAEVRVQVAQKRLSQVLAAQQSKIDRREAGQLAKATGGKAGAGRPPLPLDRAPKVIAARRALQTAEQALHRARGDPNKGAVPKGNTTDPRSRIMPAKTGGTMQAYNLQALASRRQVIVAITIHDNPVDVAALHPLLKAGRASLDAAGVTATIGKGLFDAGYASTANFTVPTEVELYVAVHNGVAQSGDAPATDKAMPHGWQPMADRMDTEPAKKLYRQRSGIIEPVFAQLFNRLGRHLNYRGDMIDTELHLWALTHNLLKHSRLRAKRAPHATVSAPLPATA